jgi:hypothetical protein
MLTGKSFTVTLPRPGLITARAIAVFLFPVTRSILFRSLILSTVLTLFVVPCAYEVFSRFERHTHDITGEDIKA